MTPFVAHRGVAAPMLQANIDTDAIIPSREMKRVSKRGLSEGLFANWRYIDPSSRTLDPTFVLNQPTYREASILLAGPNFGCGSSREHAVWALAEYGIRAIIAPSFGAIFSKNCVGNGILTAVASATAIDKLADWVAADPQSNQPTVDLEHRCIAGKETISFDVADSDRENLMSGLDAISYTLTLTDEVNAFEAEHRRQHPWTAIARP